MWDHITNHSKISTLLWPNSAQFILQMTASHFSWIHETLEKLGKDGKEAVWRTVGEGVAPETINLAENLGCTALILVPLYIQSKSLSLSRSFPSLPSSLPSPCLSVCLSMQQLLLMFAMRPE